MNPRHRGVGGYQELAKTIGPKINKQIKDLEDMATQQVMSWGSEVKQLLVSHDLAYYEKVHHRFVCTDPSNREGEMLIPGEFHELLYLIACRKGWVPEETALALASELPPGPKGNKIRASLGR